MPFSFFTALSGLRASSDALGVTGNNIANANTTAFKRGQISFSDLYVESFGVRLNGASSSVQVGNGVRTSTSTNYTQGGLADAGSPTSAAIQGNGLFIAQNVDGTQVYTRAGNFVLDRAGYLTTPDGMNVQGYAAIDGQIPPDAPLSSLQVPIGQMLPPVETTEATLRLNLNSTDADGSTFHSIVRVYDSKGVEHQLDLVFTKTGDGAYNVDATVDGNPAQLNVDGGGAGAGPAAITFDANGMLETPDTLSVVPDPAFLNGATLAGVEINLRQTNPDGTPGDANWTSYAAPSAVASTQQDGFAAGTVTGLSISSDGTGVIYSVGTNGQIRQLGQLGIATFNSVDGLRHLGNNLYTATIDSGEASVGAPETGGRGAVIGGALETSNVEITNEFIDLIVAQRSFQANSRVITTINQVLQDLLQSV